MQAPKIQRTESGGLGQDLYQRESIGMEKVHPEHMGKEAPVR